MLTKVAVLFVTGMHGTRGQSSALTVLGLTFHLPLWVLSLEAWQASVASPLIHQSFYQTKNAGLGVRFSDGALSMSEALGSFLSLPQSTRNFLSYKKCHSDAGDFYPSICVNTFLVSFVSPPSVF